jgi:hypothetical protein
MGDNAFSNQIDASIRLWFDEKTLSPIKMNKDPSSPISELSSFNELPPNSKKEAPLDPSQIVPSVPSDNRIAFYLQTRSKLKQTKRIIQNFLENYVSNTDEKIDVDTIFNDLEAKAVMGRCSENTIHARVSHICGYLKLYDEEGGKEAVARKKKLLQLNQDLTEVLTELSNEHIVLLTKASNKVAANPTTKNIKDLLVLVFIFAFPFPPKVLCELTFRDFERGRVTVNETPYVIGNLCTFVRN